jgi:hypothetical protein
MNRTLAVQLVARRHTDWATAVPTSGLKHDIFISINRHLCLIALQNKLKTRQEPRPKLSSDPEPVLSILLPSSEIQTYGAICWAALEADDRLPNVFACI